MACKSPNRPRLKKTICQLDLFNKEEEPLDFRIEKIKKSLMGLFKRVDDLRKDIEFQSDELEDLIKENIT